MSTKKTLVILAGGLGSRYNGLKQVDGILENNASLLEYSIYDALKAGFNKIVFIINELIPESFIEKLSEILISKKVEYHWVIQRKSDFVNSVKISSERIKPWGTGHALLCVKDVVNEDFLVINADDYYGASSYEKAYEMIKNKEISSNQYGVIGYILKNTLSPNGSVSRGSISIDDNSKMLSVEELTNIEKIDHQIVYHNNNQTFPLNEDTLVSMNFWIFNPSIFDFLNNGFQNFLNTSPTAKQEFYLPTFVNELIQKNIIQVKVETSKEMWKGVTYANDKSDLQDFLQQKIDDKQYPTLLWN